MESGAVSFKKEQDPSKMDPVPLLLSMMAKQYWSMLVIKEMSAHHREAGELAKELGTSPWNIKKMLDQAKNFSEASLREDFDVIKPLPLRSRGRSTSEKR
jgi:DNA polymerase III delta subunit